MSHLMAKKSDVFFRGRESVFSNLNIYVCGQLVDMCDSATHLGQFISSTDKKSIVKSAKSCFWRSFNFLCLILVNCHILSNVNYLTILLFFLWITAVVSKEYNS